MESSEEISILTIVTILRKRMMILDQGLSSTQIMFLIWMIQTDQSNLMIEIVETLINAKF